MNRRPCGRALVAAILLGLALAWAASSSPATAQTSGVRREGDRVYFNLQQVDVRSALESISEVLGISYVMGGNVPPGQLITISTAEGIPIEEVPSVLDGVLRTYNLTLVRTGNVFTVMQAQDASQMPGQPGSSPTEVHVYYLRNANAVDVANVLGQLFQGGGVPPGGFSRSTRQPRSLSQELAEQRLDPEPAVEGMAEPPVMAGEPGMVQVIAGDLVGQTAIVPDETTNSLVIRTAPENLATIEETIRKLDVRPLQVLIEVTVAEITLDESTQFGIDFSVTQRDVIGDDDTRTDVTLEGAEIDGGLTVSVVDVGDVEATLQALAADSRVNVLSTPRILSVNNKEARILVGSEVPFVQFQRSALDENVDRVVQYRNVGLELTVTSRINPDRYVTLDLLQQVSSLTADVLFDAPIISTREAETSLVVGDRQTVVLGGLIEDRQDRRRSGIPILKDIPLLGLLFGSRSTRTIKTELVITLTPYIVGTDEELQRLRGEIEYGAPLYRRELERRVEDGRPVPGRLGPSDAAPGAAPPPVVPSPPRSLPEGAVAPAEPGGAPIVGPTPEQPAGGYEVTDDFDSGAAIEPGFEGREDVIGDTIPTWSP
ncbi:MAG: type II secretion system protein GspD [Gemmatimonadota bacterium]